MRRLTLLIAVVLLPLLGISLTGAVPEEKSDSAPARVADKPADAGGEGHKPAKFKHIEFDVARKQVRVECEALGVNAPLEFFCCVTGTNEHESVLRSPVKPSDVHTALLMVGLKPGEPVTYSEALNKWIAPHGPPLHIDVEFEKEGKTVTYPARRWMREVKTKKEPPAFTWVFTGSRVMPDGKYAADVTGYLVSIVNFDLTMIDVPKLVSSSNETLEWERNAELMPKQGTKVWMVISPAGKEEAEAAAEKDPPGKGGKKAPTTKSTQPPPDKQPERKADTGGESLFAASPQSDEQTGQNADAPLSDVKIDEARVKKLREYWEKKVAPHTNALREAAQAHYEVLSALRGEQHRLIDEADRIQRAIDELEKEYQDMTTPRPRMQESGTPG